MQLRIKNFQKSDVGVIILELTLIYIPYLKFSRSIPASLRIRWENQMELLDSMVGCQY